MSEQFKQKLYETDWKKIAIFSACILIVGIGAYLFRQKVSGPKEDAIDPEKIGYFQLKDSEMIFADKLELCDAHKTVVKHPLTGEDVEKEIIGTIGDECVYIEQLLEDEKLECRYSESERKAMAQYYRDAISIEPGQEVSDIGNSGSKMYSIDGREVDNPLQEAFERGSCVIHNSQK